MWRTPDLRKGFANKKRKLRTGAQRLGSRRISGEARNHSFAPQTLAWLNKIRDCPPASHPQHGTDSKSKLRFNGKKAHEADQESLPEAGVRIDAIGAPALFFHRLMPDDVFAPVGVCFELESEGNALNGIVYCCRRFRKPALSR